MADMDPKRMAAQAAAATGLLKALANRNRLMVLCHLAGREMTVGELAGHVGLSLSALSQHLAGLRAAAIVQARRNAREIHYRLKPGPAGRIMAVLADIYCAPPHRPSKRAPRSTASPSSGTRSGRRAGRGA